MSSINHINDTAAVYFPAFGKVWCYSNISAYRTQSINARFRDSEKRRKQLRFLQKKMDEQRATKKNGQCGWRRRNRRRHIKTNRIPCSPHTHTRIHDDSNYRAILDIIAQAIRALQNTSAVPSGTECMSCMCLCIYANVHRLWCIRARGACAWVQEREGFNVHTHTASTLQLAIACSGVIFSFHFRCCSWIMVNATQRTCVREQRHIRFFFIRFWNCIWLFFGVAAAQWGDRYAYFFCFPLRCLEFWIAREDQRQIHNFFSSFCRFDGGVIWLLLWWKRNLLCVNEFAISSPDSLYQSFSFTAAVCGYGESTAYRLYYRDWKKNRE